MNLSYIYVIAPKNLDHHQCKIGVSNKPDRRLKQLQTGFPEKLMVHHEEPVDRDKVYLLEKLLHRDIGHHKMVGEWFKLTVEEAIGFIRYVIITYSDVSDLKWKMKRGRI